MTHRRHTLRGLSLTALAALGGTLCGGRVAAQAQEPSPPPTQMETPPAPGASQPIPISPDSVEHISVDADHVEGSQEQNAVLASGNVRAVITQRDPKGQPVVTTVLADIVSADLDRRVLTAEGNVAVQREGYVARGRRVEYHWQEQTGQVLSVSTHEYGLSFQAARMTYTPGRQIIEGAVFSACGLDRPDLLIRARRVDVIPNRKIVARGVGIEVFHTRLFHFPRLVYKLHRGQAQSSQGLPVATPGYSRVSGFRVRQPIPLGDDMDGDVELTTRVGVRGRFRYEADAPVAPYVEADWRQEHGVRGRSPVLVSRLPQAGLLFGANHDADVNLAYIRENSTHTRAGRATGEWNHRFVDRGTGRGLTLRGGARISAYTGGEVYRTVSLEASVGQGDFETLAEAGVRIHGRDGHTPFLWDQVQIPSEVFGVKHLPWRRYRLDTEIRYDLGRGEVYDLQIGIARKLRCIEPEIVYSSRNRSLMFRFRAVGFTTRDANDDDAPAALTRGSETAG